MSRVVTMSRQSTHQIELRRLGFDVLNLPSGSVPRVEDMADVSAVMLDVGDLSKTEATVRAIRRLDSAMPIVVLGSAEEGWARLESVGNTLVVVPPVTFNQVGAALRSLESPTIGGAPLAPVTQVVPEVPEVVPDGVIELPPEPRPDVEHRVDATPAPLEIQSAASTKVQVVVAAESEEIERDVERESADAWTTAPRRRRILRRGSRRPPATWMAGTDGDGRPWQESAQAVLDGVAVVPSVGDASDRLAHVLLEAVEADSVAVLVAEDGRWQVWGGVGVRPIETRLTLTSDDWIVSELSRGIPVVSIPDTDAVRAELAFTPLARHSSLLAAVFNDAHCLLLVGRNARPFESDEVADVLECLRNKVAALAEALDARHLARQLARFL